MKINLAEPALRKKSYSKTKETLLGKFPSSCVKDTLSGTHYHNNYLEYLELSWGNHYGIVITPDVIWHTLLSEVTQIVSENPDRYASLFTTTPGEKQKIIVVSSSLVEMPLNTLVDSLKLVVPTKADIFLPEFTTTTPQSMLSRYASFADMVSPYYSYFMFMCGIPYVDALGSVQDWQNLLKCWSEISELFPEEHSYFSKVKNLLARMINEMDNPVFWQYIFRLENCGSGSQTEVFGWWADLYRKLPTTRYVCNFSTHIAKVCYKQLNTGKDYEMYQGIFHSNLEDDRLVPDFASIICLVK